MAQHFMAYTVIYQPRRLKLPAEPIPKGTPIHDYPKFLFDEEMNRRYFTKVAEKCYHPATRMFLEMADQGFKQGVLMKLLNPPLDGQRVRKHALDHVRRRLAEPGRRQGLQQGVIDGRLV